MGSGGLQHGIHIQSGGAVRMFVSASDICAPATTVGADWERLSKYKDQNYSHNYRIRVARKKASVKRTSFSYDIIC